MRDFERFEDIPAWQEALQLTKLVYEHTTDGPWAVDDILRGEIRTNSINIATKIAQGHARQDVLEFRKAVSTALSLTSVIKTHLYIAMELEYLDQAGFDAVNAVIESTRNMIDFLMEGLKRSSGRRGEL
jgi:four helix bundle protein